MGAETLDGADATETLALLRDGRVTSEEILELYLDRIERYPWVNAVVTLDAEGGRERARAADRERARGCSRGLLHGLPMTVKHDLQVAGLASTYGSRMLRDFVPNCDAEAVSRLRAEGAIVFGRSNLPEFAADGQAYNEIHGTTKNPWNPERTPGGSSGGSAAAVAAGMTGLELGSDMGGSIRIPASWCGVFGLKPTWGVVPMQGAVPHPDDAEGADLVTPEVAVSGPIARSAEDLDLALTVLSRPLPGTSGWRCALPKPRFDGVRGLRVLAWFDDDQIGLDPHTNEILELACDALVADGAIVERKLAPPGGLDELEHLFEVLFMADLGGSSNDESYSSLTVAMRELHTAGPMFHAHHKALGLTHREWLLLRRRRDLLTRDWEEVLKRFDVIVTPTVLTTALPHDHSEPVWERTFVLGDRRLPWRPTLTRWCGAVGVLGLPAVTAPVGLDRTGLPVGMQVIAGRFEDRSAIAAAGLIARSAGWSASSPLTH